MGFVWKVGKLERRGEGEGGSCWEFLAFLFLSALLLCTVIYDESDKVTYVNSHTQVRLFFL